jgi:threonine dehydratase
MAQASRAFARGPNRYPRPMPDDLLVTSERIAAARARIAGQVHRTPMLSSETAARVVRAATGARLADDTVYLKAEHLQKTGSYKPRGMLAKVSTLTPEERRQGIITISAGNAAAGYAYAARVIGVPVTVVMPINANPTKVAACREYGAIVELIGETFDESWAAVDELAAERNLLFCHPYDDPEVIAGQATVGLEILEDLPDVDVVVVPVGGGGLISGVATALGRGRPSTRIYGVEPEGSDAMRRALAAGHSVRISPHSVADGLNGPYAGEWNLAAAQHFVTDVVLVDDATILTGLRFALERTKQVLEPAGAAGLAALLTGRIPVNDGERVCAVLSGGNVDLGRLGVLLEHAAPVPIP